MQKTVVLNVVGLSGRLLGEHTPRLHEFARRGAQARIGSLLPAVTCSVQATYLTGQMPRDHGIVGNGWYFRDECEIKFWRQSNHLIGQPKIWDMARKIDPSFTVANLFWWYNMYSSADWSVTPRPMYPADGRKLPDIYTQPAELRPALQAKLGQFPLFKFWGPNTTIESTQWIADAARYVEEQHSPTLTLIYLPHLDYVLQRAGPDDPGVAHDLHDIDALCGDLIEFYEARGAQVIVLSEYGITPVARPVHLNRLFRELGLIAVRDELGRELLDAGMSRAFAVADHQVAHVYVNDRSKLREIAALLRAARGVAEVLDEDGKRRYGLDHERAGDLVAIAEPDAWFTYYYWLDDERAPDYARTVDIHRKPGYDPAELFIDPALAAPNIRAAYKLARKQLGFRYLMDLTPLDASLVRGSHGRCADDPRDGPVLIVGRPDLLHENDVAPTDVCGVILSALQR